MENLKLYIVQVFFNQYAWALHRESTGEVFTDFAVSEWAAYLEAHEYMIEMSKMCRDKSFKMTTRSVSYEQWMKIAKEGLPNGS